MLLVGFVHTAKDFLIKEKVSMCLGSFSWLSVFFLTQTKCCSIFVV